MWVEGHHHGHGSEATRRLLEHPEHLLVAAVHAIEDADGDREPGVARQLVDAADVVHG